MRRSSPESWVTATPPWRMKALRAYTSRLTPRRVSPQLAPVRPGTGSAVPV